MSLYVYIFLSAHLCITIFLLDILILWDHDGAHGHVHIPRLAILRRHCPEPAAAAGVEWWTLCLAARSLWADVLQNKKCRLNNGQTRLNHVYKRDSLTDTVCPVKSRVDHGCLALGILFATSLVWENVGCQTQL